MNEIGVAVLLVLLAIAAWCDVSSYRIPNMLILLGLIVGLMLRLSAGGWAELVPAVQGLLVGIGVLLPMYLLGAMGAGDVKLMGMVGIFLGPWHVLGAWLATLLIGGVLALLFALYRKKLDVMLVNMREMMMAVIYKPSVQQVPRLDAVSASAGNLPYGIAIALGTALYLIWQHAVWLGP